MTLLIALLKALKSFEEILKKERLEITLDKYNQALSAYKNSLDS